MAIRQGDKRVCDQLCLDILADQFCRRPTRIQANLLLFQTSNESKARLEEILRLHEHVEERMSSFTRPLDSMLLAIRKALESYTARHDELSHDGHSLRADIVKQIVLLSVTTSAGEDEAPVASLAAQIATFETPVRSGLQTSNVAGQRHLSDIRSFGEFIHENLKVIPLKTSQKILLPELNPLQVASPNKLGSPVTRYRRTQRTEIPMIPLRRGLMT